MFGQNAFFATFGAAVIAIVLLLAGGYFSNPDVVVALIGLGGGIFGGLQQYRWAKEAEVNGRLFSEKQAVYAELITLIMSMFRPEALRSKNAQKTQAQLASELLGIRTKLIIWGSADTVRALDEASTLADYSVVDVLERGLRWQERLFTAIRIDLGHTDPPGTGLEIALGLLTSEDRAKVRARLAN